jgi:AcrR family transcriptional regulator
MDRASETKISILEAAMEYAREFGLEVLSIGKLANIVGMSKSGLFAHFNSKEKLQIQILEHASEVFTEDIFKPAIKKPRGIPRIRAFFENWLKWADSGKKGGCIFVAASIEFDDIPGKVRDYIHGVQKIWISSLAYSAKLAVGVGDFPKDTDTEQFAFELLSIMLGYHHFNRLLDDPKAKRRTKLAFENLVARYKREEGA